MVLVDIRETPSAKAADIFLQIRPGQDFEVVTTLRALLKGQPVDSARSPRPEPPSRNCKSWSIR